MSYRRPDHFALRARAEGYPARSVYKLQELDRRLHLLRPGMRVLDLGCAPGSWSRFAGRRTGARGVVVGVDVKPVEGFPGRFVLASVLEVDPERLRRELGGEADVVLSDMAPSTSGDRFGDHVRQLELARAAAAIASALLASGGALVVKVFDGPDAPAFAAELRSGFRRLRRLKPAATRARSVEFYLAALGFRGGAGGQ